MANNVGLTYQNPYLQGTQRQYGYGGGGYGGTSDIDRILSFLEGMENTGPEIGPGYQYPQWFQNLQQSKAYPWLLGGTALAGLVGSGMQAFRKPEGIPGWAWSQAREMVRPERMATMRNIGAQLAATQQRLGQQIAASTGGGGRYTGRSQELTALAEHQSAEAATNALANIQKRIAEIAIALAQQERGGGIGELLSGIGNIGSLLAFMPGGQIPGAAMGAGGYLGSGLFG